MTTRRVRPAATVVPGPPPVEEEKDPFLIGRFRFNPNWVHRHWSDGYFRWLVIISFAVWYNVIFILPRAVFHEIQEGPLFVVFTVLDYVCDILYLADMVMKVLTGYLENGILIREPRKLLRKYLKSKDIYWDIISIFPMDLFYILTGVLAPFPILRINRILRQGRVSEFYHRAQTRLESPNTFRLLYLIAKMVVVVHLNACVYYYVSHQVGIGMDRWAYPGRAGWRYETAHGGGGGHGGEEGHGVSGADHGADGGDHGSSNDTHDFSQHSLAFENHNSNDSHAEHGPIADGASPAHGPSNANPTSNGGHDNSHTAGGHSSAANEADLQDNAGGSGHHNRALQVKRLRRQAHDSAPDSGRSANPGHEQPVGHGTNSAAQQSAQLSANAHLNDNAHAILSAHVTSAHLIPVSDAHGRSATTISYNIKRNNSTSAGNDFARLFQMPEEETTVMPNVIANGHSDDTKSTVHSNGHDSDQPINTGHGDPSGHGSVNSAHVDSAHAPAAHVDSAHSATATRNREAGTSAVSSVDAHGDVSAHAPVEAPAHGGVSAHGEASAHGESHGSSTGEAGVHGSSGSGEHGESNGHGSSEGHGEGGGHGGSDAEKPGHEAAASGHHKPIRISPDFINDTFYQKYSYCMYWSVKMMTSKPYEIANPQTTTEFIFHLADAFLGILMFASIVGEVDGIIESINKKSDDFKSHLDSVKQYINMRKVGKDMESRVVKWFDYIWSVNASLDEDSVLTVLPEKLRIEIAKHVHLDVLKKVPIFQGIDEQFLLELAEKLKFEAFCPGDYICRRGDIGRHIYVIRRGLLNIIGADGVKVVVTLKAGVVFGELSLLNVPGSVNGNRRTVTVRSVGYAELFSLSKEDFWTSLEEYPEVKDQLMEKAKKTLQKDNLVDENIAREQERRGRNFQAVADKLEESLETVTVRMDRFWQEQIDVNQKLLKKLNLMEDREKALAKPAADSQA